jgi:ankyrin repeat protein
MHFAVANKSLGMVRVLDEHGADATAQNVEGLCPIDIAIAEDFRDIKLHFMS